MPIFSDKIIVNTYLDQLKFDKGFKFRIDKLGLELNGYDLKEIECRQFEFTSVDTVYKVPREEFGEGEIITILENGDEEDLKKGIVRKRDFLRQKEENFKNLNFEDTEDNRRFVSIDCQLRFDINQMNWILVGSSPSEMEDRMIMYTKDDKILIYASWTGALYYEAKYKGVGRKEFCIYKLNAVKRNVKFSQDDFIRDFKRKIEGHLNQVNWINKWSKEFLEKNRCK